ncbi:uncharacterized protein LOC143910205 [Arctopsyche grandis]|uniref:uncharacterized protein LOC143910205 n=1 Tax=Arctopsyche grandis TaxID=121162 RepID=UPI00406D884A
MAAGGGNFWIIDDLATFKDTEWSKIQYPKLGVRIMYDLLVILSDDTVIFKLKLNNKSKACYKDKTVLLAYAEEDELHKIKFKLICTEESAQSFINTLSIYLPIHNVNTSGSGKLQAKIEVTGFQELFREELKRQTNYSNNESVFPPEFQLNEFLKLCIMDPTFPDMVDEVEKSLHKYLH